MTTFLRCCGAPGTEVHEPGCVRADGIANLGRAIELSAVRELTMLLNDTLPRLNDGAHRWVMDVLWVIPRLREERTTLPPKVVGISGRRRPGWKPPSGTPPAQD